MTGRNAAVSRIPAGWRFSAVTEPPNNEYRGLRGSPAASRGTACISPARPCRAHPATSSRPCAAGRALPEPSGTPRCDRPSGSPQIGVDLCELDSDPYVMNVLNGTIDLRTGKLRPHSAEDYLTKLVPIEFHMSAFNRRVVTDVAVKQRLAIAI